MLIMKSVTYVQSSFRSVAERVIHNCTLECFETAVWFDFCTAYKEQMSKHIIFSTKLAKMTLTTICSFTNTIRKKNTCSIALIG